MVKPLERGDMRRELLKKELKIANNNVLTVMETRIMAFVRCDRRTANYIANEILDIDRDSESILRENEDIENE